MKLRSRMFSVLFIVYLVLGAGPFCVYAQERGKEQSRAISGSITDTEGEPLIGAVVYDPATKNGVIADENGEFTIKISSDNVTLKISYLGMEEQTVRVTPSETWLDIVLRSDTQLEAAVINAGYGVIQSRENLTGSAFEVRGEALKLKPSTRLDDLLVGQVPGMNVIEDNSTGRPNIKIRIRGDGSLSASNEPLWVIDGVPVYTGSRTNSVTGTNYTVSPLSYLNPDDIESMTVLKDASTTALYGADGANGVILVTTRNAKSGKTTFNASVKYGVSAVDRSTTIRYTTAEQWLELAKLGWTNSGRPIEAFPYQDNEYNSYSTTNTDWFKEYYGLGQTTEVNFSANGGNEKLEHFFSFGYYNNKTPVMGNNQDRYSLRGKTRLNFTEKFTADINISATYNDNDIFSISSNYLRVIPIFEPYNPDGSFRLYNYYSTNDNIYQVEKRKFVYNTVPEREANDNNQKTLSADANLTLTFKPFKGLDITSQSGVSYINIYESEYDSSKTLDGIYESGQNGHTHKGGVFSTVFNENLRANYNKTFFDKLAFSAMVGTELTSKIHTYLQASGHGFINDHIKEIAYSDASTRDGTSNYSQTKSLSYIGFASLTYDSRYALTLSYRRQGNSAFSEYSRWADFSSVGATWNIHREHFFNSNAFSTLSVKASFGNNGNSRVDTSSSYGSYSLSEGNYYGGAPGANQSSPANPGLSWETTYITNIGLNVGLWKKYNLSVEYYIRDTKNLLYDGRVSSIITDGSVTRNVGEIRNEGLEFTLDANLISRRDFSWDISINGASNKNTILKLYKGMHTGFFNQVWTEGESKDAWWLVRWAGVDPATGAPMWYDKNGDLTYTFSMDNRVTLPEYSKEPKLYGGLSSDMKYGNWNLRLMFDYQIGGWEYSSELTDDGQDIIGWNAPVEELDYWEKPGDVARNTKFSYKHGTTSYYYSTRCLFNATYVQLRTLSLGYTLPSEITRNWHVNNVTFSLVGDNLYLWTPGQSATHNSYKTIKYSTGMKRGLSFKLSFNF